MEKHFIVLYIFIFDKNFYVECVIVKLNLKTKHGSYLHPGFLSFGSVRDYTLISPSYTSPVFDACLRLVM